MFLRDFVASSCDHWAKSYIEFRHIGEFDSYESLFLFYLYQSRELDVLRVWPPLLFLPHDNPRP
jgi:hypothetical protein